MKKLLIIMLVLVYGLSASGATIHLHYCCGELENVSLTTEHNPDCPQEEGDWKGCCDSKKLDLKIESDQNLAAKWTANFFSLDVAVINTEFQFSYIPFNPAFETFPTGPPLKSSVPLFLRNRVFRI
ncbi:hypothetical protein HRH25_06850 [Flavisolibacter sp. BT320]|nr:hypothetical protein [Flavisolibacter longurius]